MSLYYRAESLPALFGFEDDKEKLSTDNSIRHASTNKGDYSGVRHGILCQLELDDKRTPSVSVKHWLHTPDGKNILDDEISISFEKKVIDGAPHYYISKLVIFDKTYIDVNDPEITDNQETEKRIAGTVKAIFDTITQDGQIPDIPTILEDFGISLPRTGRRTMSGIRRGGLTATYAAASQGNNNDVSPIKYRRTFLPTMMGVEAQANKISTIDEQHDVFSDPKTGTQYDMYFTYKRDEDAPGTIKTECFLRVDQEKDAQQLYSISTKQDESDEKLSAITSLSFFGQDIDITNPVTLTRALETIRSHNIAITHRHYSRGEGVLMSEVLHETGLIPHIYKRPEAPSIEDGGRFRGRVLGGVNNGRGAVSQKESSIGGNSYAASFDYKDANGTTKSNSIIIDDGIGFLDFKKDGFDYWKASLDPFLRHMSDPKDYKTETDTLAIVYTHKHKDHFFWEPGYVPPALIMEPLTLRQFEDDVRQMKELTKEQQNDLIAACHVVDPLNDVSRDNPDKVKRSIYGDTVVEQWTEVFDDPENASGKGYAPRLRLYKQGEEEGAMQLRLNYVSHSAPCLMVDIVTPAKTIGLTGDFKFTNDVYVGNATNRAWISAQQRDFLLMETTGADREEKTPDYQELEDNYTEFFYDRASQGRRLLMPIMPNDVQTLFCVANAMKRARAKLLTDNPDTETLSHFTADGKTLEDMVRYLNNGEGTFKKFLSKDEYDVNGELVKAGIKYFGRTSKAIKALTKENGPRRADLAIAITGTQTEDMSVMTRASDGELDRWDITSKDTILNTKKGIPVGRNIQLRRAQKDHVESTYGAEYILPEDYERDTGKILAVSGHGGKADLEEMVSVSNATHIGVTHGTTSKFDIVEDMIRKAGKRPLRLTHQEERGGSLKDGFNFLAQTEEYRQYAREVYPRPFFWRTKWKDRAMVKMLPVLGGPIGELVQRTEESAINLKRKSSEHRRRHIVANDNQGSTYSDAAPANPKIGVQREDDPFYKSRNIATISSADTEGTGLVEEKARLSQYAHHTRDIDSRKQISKAVHKMKTPKHAIWSLFAALKTNSHPKSFTKGDEPRVFAHKVNQSLVGLKKHPKDESKDGKALLLGYNFHRHDALLLSKEMGLNGQRDLFNHRSSGTYLFDVRQFARMVHGYHRDILNVTQKPTKNSKGSFPDFSLEGLCIANGIDYPRTHNALDDTYPAYALYEFIETKLKAAGREDILEQALLNCDTHEDVMAKDIIGANLRPGTPRPVFSYISHRADRAEPRLGVVVGTEITATSGRALIIFNLDYDPEKYLDADEDTLYEMAKDYKNDVFDVIYLDRHPILAPMDFAFAYSANKKKVTLSKQSYIARAHSITRNMTRSIEQNAVAENKRTKQKKIIPFEMRVLKAFGRSLTGMYASRNNKDTIVHNIDRNIYRIPKLKSEWGLIKRSSEDMKAYHIAPTEDELDGETDHRHIGRMAVLLGQIHNEELLELLEENVHDLWTPLSDKDKDRVSRLISSQLRKENTHSREERHQIKRRIMNNIELSIDHVQTRRALVVHAPASANHISLKKAWAQYDRVMRDKDLYDEFVENDPKKEAILKAWPQYLKSIENDPNHNTKLAHSNNNESSAPAMRNIARGPKR
jgi:mRNA degradation ribonuclease J1/J2